MRIARTMPIVMLILAVTVSTVHAEDKVTRNGCRCFFGRPSPRCCSFVLMDGAVIYRVAESNFRDGSEDFLISGELGYMFNRGPNWAFGAGFYFGGDDDASRYALRPRVRRWLTDRTALDLSAGVIFAGSDDHVEIKPPGISASASIGLANWISLTMTYEAVRIGPKENFPNVLPPGSDPVWRSGLYIGATGSHWVALALPIVLGVAVAATWDDGFE